MRMGQDEADGAVDRLEFYAHSSTPGFERWGVGGCFHTEFTRDFNIFFQGFQGFLLECSTQISTVLDYLHTFLSYKR
jgi:hypothetical protein